MKQCRTAHSVMYKYQLTQNKPHTSIRDFNRVPDAAAVPDFVCLLAHSHDSTDAYVGLHVDLRLTLVCTIQCLYIDAGDVRHWPADVG